jgi:hypothetical protein
MAVPAIGRSGAATPQPRPDRRPDLQVVSGGRRRWPAVVGAVVLLLVITAMFGAAVFHTQLAERQLEVDRLERQVSEERVRFDELRRDRAVLRSPERIAEEATKLGMVPSDSVRFVAVDPTALAVQLAAAGVTDDSAGQVITDPDPLDQFRDVKAVSEGQP